MGIRRKPLLHVLFHSKRSVALISVIITCSIGALLRSSIGVWCEALDDYTRLGVDDLKDAFLWLLIYAPAILFLGALAYRKLHGRSAFLNTSRGTVAYFMLLTIAAFPLQFSSLLLDRPERHMERAICNKSTSNGMVTNTAGLSIQEYAYLKTLLPLLPLLPDGADSLRVHFYSDGFLPDFSLQVVCAVKRGEVSAYPPYQEIQRDGPTGWMLDTTRFDPEVAWLIYEDGRS